MSKIFPVIKEKRKLLHVKENIELYLIMLPVLLHIFIFSYIPLYGIVIAFQNYFPGSSFIAFDGSVEWVGLQHIIDFVKSIYFNRVFGNTLILSFYQLAFGFWIPILFALLVNELRNKSFKKFVQTASYLPHFISSVIVAGMVLSFVNPNGIVNDIIIMLGGTRINFNIESKYFPAVYTITNIWKSFGWSSILYLSSISSIDPNLYEASRIDGANRFHQMRFITIPSIMPTIFILLIFQIGGLLGSNTEFVLLLYNPAIYEKADVIGTYVYRDGLLGGRFSYGTAVSLFTSVINFAMLFAANTLSQKVSDYSLW